MSFKKDKPYSTHSNLCILMTSQLTSLPWNSAFQSRLIYSVAHLTSPLKNSIFLQQSAYPNQYVHCQYVLLSPFNCCIPKFSHHDKWFGTYSVHHLVFPFCSLHSHPCHSCALSLLSFVKTHQLDQVFYISHLYYFVSYTTHFSICVLAIILPDL